jgi:hypothetical protein
VPGGGQGRPKMIGIVAEEQERYHPRRSRTDASHR